jgi:serine/threonine-protein kinase
MGWINLAAWGLAGFVLATQAEHWKVRCEEAESLIAQGRYREAETALMETKGLAAQQLAAENPSHARIETGLGRVMEGLGMMREAERHHRRALAILEKTFGPQHPQLEEPLRQLGQLYINGGQISKAGKILERLGQLWPESSGPPPAAKMRRQQLVVELLLLQHRWKEALEESDAALRVSARERVEQAVLESHFWNLRASALSGMGRWQEAVASQNEAVSSYERRTPCNRFFLLKYRHSLAFLLIQASEYREASGMLPPMIAGAEMLLGPEHIFVGRLMLLQGHVLRKLKRKDEAAVLEKHAREIFALRAQDDPFRHTIDIQALGRGPT